MSDLTIKELNEKVDKLVREVKILHGWRNYVLSTGVIPTKSNGRVKYITKLPGENS